MGRNQKRIRMGEIFTRKGKKNREIPLDGERVDFSGK